MFPVNKKLIIYRENQSNIPPATKQLLKTSVFWGADSKMPYTEEPEPDIEA